MSHVGNPKSIVGGAKPPGAALADALARCETEWQRVVIREWGRRNPNPVTIGRDRLEVVASPMTCAKCETPGVAVPDMSIAPERGYFICPRCSMPKRHLQVVG